MKRAMILAAAAAAVVVVVSAGGSVRASAETEVTLLQASAENGRLDVEGRASFVDRPATLGVDPTGDAGYWIRGDFYPVSGQGMDLTRVTVSRPDPQGDVIRISWESADMPERCLGETWGYWWEFSALGTEAAQPHFAVSAFCTSLGFGNQAPAFHLHRAVRSGPGQLYSAWGDDLPVSGSLGRFGMSADLSLSALGSPSALEPFAGNGGPLFVLGSGTIARSGRGYEYRQGLGAGDGSGRIDQIAIGTYEIPVPRVDLGIAPSGTDLGSVPLTVRADLTVDRAFSGSLNVGDGQGSYVLVARACNGAGNCGLRSMEIVL